MNNDREVWATDTLVSRPEPSSKETPVLVDFEGFGFTMNGMVHNITESEIEAMVTPTFAPEGYRGSLPDDHLDSPEEHF